MSEYVRKQALLEWLKEQFKTCGDDVTGCEALNSVMLKIVTGAFDAPDGEVQRLRAENERYRKALERIAETDIPYAPMTDHSVIRFYEQVAREALASTPTEPSGAELVKCVICKTIAYPNGRWKKAHYGDVCPDCRSGRRIKAPEKVGTEEWRHKYFGAEWPEAKGDGNDYEHPHLLKGDENE